VVTGRALCCLAALGAALVGCGSSQDSAADAPAKPWLTEDPLGTLPNKLSEVGIYSGSQVSKALAPALSYEPGYPLWSDGGQKFRSVVLPEGGSIDASDPQNYVFPLGTLIFKTFSFRTPTSPNAVVPVETRLLHLTSDGWELAAYGWDETAADAELLDLKRSQPREVLSEDGSSVQHVIPSRLECRQCHESSTSEVLGINELQLAKSGSLHDTASRLSPTPSETPLTLPEHGPLTTSVLGYFVGNCVHCHNGTNGAASSFDLRPDVALANIIDQPTASSATADGIRVTPGKPAESVLYLGVKGGSELEVKDMPPLGVALRDAGAVQLLADWIQALGDEKDP
jgi:hypothetical protein